MNFVLRIAGLFLAAMLVTACKVSQSVTKAPDLLTFQQGPVSKTEFERVYAKNNGGPEEAARHSPAQLREYLDLYIHFKRKVFEAEALGLDTTNAFKQEFNTYRKQLAQPYLSAAEVEDQIIREAYDRSQYLVNANHLLLQVAEGASPADTLKVYQRIRAIRDTIVSGGASFVEMARRHSSDPSVAQNDGNLGYFSAFDMVYPFENAAFTPPAGSLSQPVRTQFGYHLVQVNEKLPTQGKKRVAHIIIRIGDRYSAKDTASAVKKIEELYARLQAGADFAELAVEYSDDPVSGQKGGDLGMGRLLPEMEEYKIKLPDQAYSRPFTTAYGWHILKVTEVEPIKSFDEAKAELKQRVSRDSRSQVSREALLERIKRDNNYVYEPFHFEIFKASLDNNFPRGAWHPDTAQAALYAQPLFRLGSDRVLTTHDFIEHYKRSRNRNARLTPDQAAESLRQEFTESELLRYEEEQLPEKNPEFRHLVGEYRDGILLFTLMEQKVWKKAVEDTTGLKAYYDSHLDDFAADEMIDVKEYRSKEKSVIEEVDKLLAQRSAESTIDSLINAESALKLRITTQTYEKGKNDPGADIFSQPETYRTPILEQDGFFKILILKKKYPAGIKPFDKARSEAITRYQDYLEAQWLQELAQKYPVEINEDVFAKLFK